MTLFLEETEKLLKDFENDSKLSDANPISLCPQATVNGDDLVNLISNPDVKVNCFYHCNRSRFSTDPYCIFRLNWFKFLVQQQSIWKSKDIIPYLSVWSKIASGNYRWSSGAVVTRGSNWWISYCSLFDRVQISNVQHQVKASGTLEWHHSMILSLAFLFAFTTVRMKI